MTITTQMKQIRKHLESGKSITPLEALRLYGCFRLGARIYDLRAEGMTIETNLIEEVGKRFAEYRLAN